jgi:hypothetical protein
MDRSSFGSALGGEDLGGNEVRAVRVATRLAPQRPVAPPSPRKPLGLLERQSHGARTNPSSCPARQTVSDGRGRVRHRLRRAHVSIRRLQISGSWHRASVLLRRLALGIAWLYFTDLARMAPRKGWPLESGRAEEEGRHTSSMRRTCAGRADGVSDHSG